jgi:catechol 2,3-dioxygenase-like lactoylglutathione lyase family enzyme
MNRPPLPPFTAETAAQKVRMAEDAWNTRDRARVAEHATPATCGVDHVGLSVRDLESTRRFFCDCLGRRVVGERPEYPAAFVSDGQQVVTLWRVKAPDQAVAFERCTNVGLHRLALALADRAGLDALYERVASWPGVVVEFASKLSGQGAEDPFHHARAERDSDRIRL